MTDTLPIPSPPVSDTARTFFDKAADKAHLHSTLEDINHELVHAGVCLGQIVKRIRHFSEQDGLPEDFRSAYRQLLATLEPIVQAVDKLSSKHGANPRRWFYPLVSPPARLHLEEVEWPPGWLDLAKRVVERINAAELEVVRQVRTVEGTLLEQHGSGIFDFTSGFDAEVKFLLQASPLRPFYDEEQVADELYEEMEISLSYYSLRFDDEEFNWNAWCNVPNFPLADCHMGYLVHALLEHEKLPWEMLPLVKNITVGIQLGRDWQVLYPTEMRDKRHHDDTHGTFSALPDLD